jgi:hypothetical protein
LLALLDTVPLDLVSMMIYKRVTCELRMLSTFICTYNTRVARARRLCNADLWTTRCTRCPDALDSLNQVAAEHEAHSSVLNGNDVSSDGSLQFISVCCDLLDGAREIIERPSIQRWSAMRHFYMPPAAKEQAKRWLGFRQVPYYVVLSARGELLFSGNKIDWDLVPGLRRTEAVDTPTKAEPADMFNSPLIVESTKDTTVDGSSPNQVFMIYDMDF